MKDVMLLTFIQAGCAQPSEGSGRCYRRESCLRQATAPHARLVLGSRLDPVAGLAGKKADMGILPQDAGLTEMLCQQRLSQQIPCQEIADTSFRSMVEVCCGLGGLTLGAFRVGVHTYLRVDLLSKRF